MIGEAIFIIVRHRAPVPTGCEKYKLVLLKLLIPVAMLALHGFVLNHTHTLLPQEQETPRNIGGEM